ncbi:MAG: methyltransferase domain-containing protein [Prosthecobacter sp.]|uniref:class I SAM-dependent methyltransferase n=1 Tax=Prosthecobacter sp. TaxID=1965333 RepID=UPI0025DD79B5|nr:methyltransferase domain-containing protein [Prosthecobacter sp.]MCF7785951.1 methyltransferase domain-containing protein [Prosthecobacter sp.]
MMPRPQASQENELLERRIKASEDSKGTSTSAIIDHALRAALKMGTARSMLEFGAGKGDLIRQLLDAGWSGPITGADLFARPESLQDNIAWVQADLNLPLQLDGASFDLVVSTEVIEHLENPRAVAREFARLLRPGGQVLLTTPNQESLRSLISLLVTGHFALFQDSCYPAHITALLRKDLMRVFKEAGFENIQFSFVAHGGIPKRPHISWQKVSGGLLHGRWFSDTIVMTAELPQAPRQ